MPGILNATAHDVNGKMALEAASFAEVLARHDKNVRAVVYGALQAPWAASS